MREAQDKAEGGGLERVNDRIEAEETQETKDILSLLLRTVWPETDDHQCCNYVLNKYYLY